MLVVMLLLARACLHATRGTMSNDKGFVVLIDSFVEEVSYSHSYAKPVRLRVSKKPREMRS